MDARQYTVTNNCTFKLNNMQYSLIFLKTCGRAVGRKNMGFGGRLFQFHFSSFISYLILFTFPKPSQPWIIFSLILKNWHNNNISQIVVWHIEGAQQC